MRRPDPLYLASAVLAIVTIAVLIATTTGPSSAGVSRTGSVYDDGPGGASALRRYLEAMGAVTSTIQGEAFAPAGDAKVVLILGAGEAITDIDAGKLRSFARTGGTVIVATEVGFLERSLFDAYGVSASGIAAPGQHLIANATFADPPARVLTIDRGVALDAGPRADVLATDGQAPLIVAVREGSGLVIFAGSLWPFLAAGLGEADNARMVLALVRPALSGGTVAFDEYHHGLHPSSDVMVLIERTWPGRALVFAAIVTFLYLLLSGRRIGPPVPLAVRPARSSLEYIRGFAGLVRRSGRGEIARRRLRADLQTGLARGLGLDPATPFDRVLATIGAQDRARATQARAVDEALSRTLPDAQLLRTVAQIEQLLARP
ncbi:MAG TPA: DUF4350 domain-containing protein [Methylomirabilota bacterium]|nr:DUF4350 domain-containing protein [Methylomirabilota bacterium]